MLKLILLFSTDNKYLNSTVCKKIRPSFNVTDVSAFLEQLQNAVGTFKLFDCQPEIYLSRIVNIAENNLCNLDAIVNSFFGLLEVGLHDWYFDNVYKKGYTFDEFKCLFVEQVHMLSYQKIRSLSFNLHLFNSLHIDKSYENNQIKFYFENKIKLLQNVFKLNDHDSKLLSLCFLEFEDYEYFLPVLNDENAFNSLVKNRDSKLNLFPNNISGSESEDSENEEIQIAEKANGQEENQENDQIQQETVHQLQVQNNKLSEDVIKLQESLDKLQEELDENAKEIKKKTLNETNLTKKLNLKEDEIKKLKKLLETDKQLLKER